MKFEIRLTKTEYNTETVFAPNRDDALRMAKEKNPGFTPANTFAEFGEDDEVKREHELLGICENCDVNIWAEQDHAYTSDDCLLCRPCANACEKASA